MRKISNPCVRIKGLYAITPDEPDTVTLLGKVRLALQGGASAVQYRNKSSETTLRFRQAAALRELTNEFGVPLIVNDDPGLAQRVNADGLHLGGEDISLEQARALLGQGKLIGISCYNRLELAHAAAQGGADYVAFGSFFASTVKPGAVQATPELLKQACAELEVPVVAIGGITPQNCEALIQAGADAVAVISAVFGVTNVQAAAQRFSDFFIPD